MPLNISGSIIDSSIVKRFPENKIPLRGLVFKINASIPESYTGSGTSVFDLSRNNINGTLTNGASYSSSNGGVFTFNDNLSQYINIPDSTYLNPGTGSFSMVAWVNLDPSIGGDFTWDLFISKRSGGSNGYYVGINNPSGVKFMLGNTANARTDTPYVSYTYNTWTMFTAILNVDTNTQTIIKNNNVELQSITPTGGTYSNTNALSIGGDIGINAYYVNGKIGNVLMYNRALSTSEINTIYNIQKSRFGL